MLRAIPTSLSYERNRARFKQVAQVPQPQELRKSKNRLLTCPTGRFCRRRHINVFNTLCQVAFDRYSAISRYASYSALLRVPIVRASTRRDAPADANWCRLPSVLTSAICRQRHFPASSRWQRSQSAARPAPHLPRPTPLWASQRFCLPSRQNS